MSNYAQTTFFTPKDSLPITDPNKTIFGAAYDVEFSNISAAIATKPDASTTASYLNVNVTGSALPANGIYLPAANNLGFTTNTVLRATIILGMFMAGATGGDKGAGTINATGLFINGSPVSTAVGANPSATIGLAAVNGVAATFMTSDSAPALSQAIAPTWTGNHVFNPPSGTPLLVKLNGTTVFSVNGTSSPTIQGYGPTAAALIDMTPDTGSFTGTLTGMTSATTGTVNWARFGNVVMLWITATIAGTSNLNTMTMTGLPAAIQPAHTHAVLCSRVEDLNGSNELCEASVTGGTITFALCSVPAGFTNFSASNFGATASTKGLTAGWSIMYPLT
jgi:hypothetical protein